MILTFLVDRYQINDLALRQAADFYSHEPNPTTQGTLAYRRNCQSCLEWLLSTIPLFRAKRPATIASAIAEAVSTPAKRVEWERINVESDSH